MSSHLGDANKKVSDTPRTDAEEFYPHDSKNKACDASFARQLERELNGANQIAKKYEDRYFASLERIKRLEEAGDVLAQRATRLGLLPRAIDGWTKAKEVKP